MRHVSESRASDILLRNHRSNVCHGDKFDEFLQSPPAVQSPSRPSPSVVWTRGRWRSHGRMAGGSGDVGPMSTRVPLVTWLTDGARARLTATLQRQLGFEGRRELPAFGLVGNQACRREPLGSRSRQTPRGVGEDARAGRSRCCGAVVATKTVVVAVLTDGRAVSWSFLWRSNNQLATEFESFLKIGVRPPDPYYSDNG